MVSKSIAVSFVVLVVSVILFYSKLFKRSMSSAQTTTTAVGATLKDLAIFNTAIPKTPVYFFSHGGPTFMYESDEFPSDIGAFKTVRALGSKIKKVIKPEFILVVSAHWESSLDNTIEIAIPKTFPTTTKDPLENELIYDFYGFPKHMYEEQFHTKNNLELAEHVKNTLISNGLNSKLTQRGIDHGVWVPFKVAFPSNSSSYWDLDIPLIQISLNHSNDFKIHKKLGEILSEYRNKGGLVICSGMSVHNLRDLGKVFQTGKNMPYTAKFNKLLTSILTGSTGQERFDQLESLKTKHTSLLYGAHPTLEHFMPIVVGSGLGWNEPAKELFNSDRGSLGWGIYQFGADV